MRIILTDNDIQKALHNYVDTLGINTEGKVVTIALQAGRGAKGYSADVDINLPGEVPVQEPAPAKAKPGRKPKAETPVEAPANEVPEANEAATSAPESAEEVPANSSASKSLFE